MLNRVQYELDLMRDWLARYGTDAASVADFCKEQDLLDDHQLHEFLGLKNPTPRQVVSRLSMKMKAWDGRYVNDRYSWESKGLMNYNDQGWLNVFGCVEK